MTGSMRRAAVRFVFRGREVSLDRLDPRATLLDWLRLEARATGTKEGCGEGDCGACTVVLARRDARGAVSWRPVNACVLLLGQVDGAEVVTVEDLDEGGTLHPVQDAMVRHHGAQCGYCTPGIVMSLFALHQGADGPVTRAAVNDQLAGNLCRCTGYRPIVDAALEVVGVAGGRREASAALADDDGRDVFVGTAERFFAAPASVEALCALLAEHPDARVVAGATDVGLWVTKALRDLPKVVWVGRVAGFDAIEEGAGALRLGAGVTHEAALPALARLHPDLGEVMRRFGSVQVRASGTVGGSIANGSPIGDLAPCLVALDATLHLRGPEGARALPLERFFLAYKRQDRAPAEVVEAVTVPRLGEDESFHAYKVSKRFDEDISAVLAAVRLRVEAGVVRGARAAFGGMAGTPARAPATEAALVGARLDDEATWAPALAALGVDFAPLSDQRASAAYRSRVARNLLLKALSEAAGAAASGTRVLEHVAAGR